MLYRHLDLTLKDLVTADAFVFVRHLALKQFPQIMSICQELNIPVYYFTDDNFIELAKTYADPTVGYLAALTSDKNYMSLFKTVFTSTPALAEYFTENNVHDNVVLFEPNIDEKNIKKPKVKKRLSIAFMGGAFRSESLQRYVIPAITKLSNKIPIDFYFPYDESEFWKTMETDRLVFHPIPRNFHLDLALNRYAQNEIDILVHPAIDIPNNKYKTMNALINATQMGAVLVASNFPPFSDTGIENKAYLVADNDENSWYEQLMMVATDFTYRKNLHKQASEYCSERFNPAKNAANLTDELNRVESNGYYGMVKNYEKMIDDYYKLKEQAEQAQAVNAAYAQTISVNTLPSPEELRLTKLEKSAVYNFICEVSAFSGLRFIFSNYGNATGVLEIVIRYGNRELRRVSTEIENLVYNKWTAVTFEPLTGVGNKKLTLEVFTRYTGTERIGIYEKPNNRSFLHKTVNKLCGRHMTRGNVMWMDYIV